jgi:hypothetical protein
MMSSEHADDNKTQLREESPYKTITQVIDESPTLLKTLTPRIP